MIKEYNIVITSDAESDLYEIKDYIAYELLVPDTALSYIRTIREAIKTLSKAAKRTPPIEDEPWHSRGVRRIMVKNFYVYYLINEEQKQVTILNVIYTKRDQLRALKKMKL